MTNNEELRSILGALVNRGELRVRWTASCERMRVAGGGRGVIGWLQLGQCGWRAATRWSKRAMGGAAAACGRRPRTTLVVQDVDWKTIWVIFFAWRAWARPPLVTAACGHSRQTVLNTKKATRDPPRAAVGVAAPACREVSGSRGRR